MEADKGEGVASGDDAAGPKQNAKQYFQPRTYCAVRRKN